MPRPRPPRRPETGIRKRHGAAGRQRQNGDLNRFTPSCTTSWGPLLPAPRPKTAQSPAQKPAESQLCSSLVVEWSWRWPTVATGRPAPCTHGNRVKNSNSRLNVHTPSKETETVAKIVASRSTTACHDPLGASHCESPQAALLRLKVHHDSHPHPQPEPRRRRLTTD